MKFFKPESAISGDQSVEGHRTHELPLVTCPHCLNFRGMPGIAYPWINIKQFFSRPEEITLRWNDSTDLTWEDYLKFASKLRPLLEQRYVLPPGTEFGPFQGKIYAKPPITDFVMPDPSLLLARRQVIQRLNELGNSLRTFETKLKQPKGKPEDLVEVWAPPVAAAGQSAGVK